MSTMETLSSTWKRGRILGKGSYGTVYLADLYTTQHHANHLTSIAVKRARLEKSSTLVRENRILECFRDCEEIVQCYGGESSVEDGHEFYNLFLEYASAGTLFDLMKKSDGCISDEVDVRIYTWMILKGLSCIHAKGIVHCDIKPENILAFPTEYEGIYQLKISDFGMAKEPDEESSKGTNRFRGTTAYMSPECASRGEIYTAMDIWSLGCVVVAMITGGDVWQGATSITIAYQLANTVDTPKIPENISEAGKDFLSKCFEKDPRKRWSAQMLLDHPYLCGD